MGHLGGETALVDSRDGVAAADDGGGAGVGDGLADAHGAVGEVGHFKAAHRAVPDDGLRALDGVGVELDGLGTDIEGHPAFRDVVGDGLDVRVVGEGVGGEVVDGEEELDVELFGLGDHVAGVLELVVLAEGLADVVALGLQERVGHAAADDERVDLREQVVHDRELVGDLRAAEDGDERTDRVVHGVAEERDFLFHEETGDGGADVLGDDGGGGVGAVGGAERVVAVDVAVGSELLGEDFLLFLELGLLRLELFVALAFLLFELALFFLVEAGVLKHHDVAGLHGLHDVVGVGAVGREGDGLAEHLGEVFGDGLQAEVGLVALFGGTAEVAHEDQAAALFEDVLDGGQGALDAGVVFDDAFLDGHVEVDAHDDAFAFEIDVA